MLPSSILQMDCCRRSLRWVIPDTVTIWTRGKLPPHRSRVNSLSKPFHLFQVVAWAVFLILVLRPSVSSFPCCPVSGSTLPLLYPFTRVAPACGLGWGGATAGLLGQRGSCACCHSPPLCSVLHTESPTGVVSHSSLPTLSIPMSPSLNHPHTPVLYVAHWLGILAKLADTHTAVSTPHLPLV